MNHSCKRTAEMHYNVKVETGTKVCGMFKQLNKHYSAYCLQSMYTKRTANYTAASSRCQENFKTVLGILILRSQAHMTPFTQCFPPCSV